MVGPSAWHLYPTRSKLISLLQNFLTWVSKMWQTCFMATYTAVVNPFVLYWTRHGCSISQQTCTFIFVYPQGKESSI